MTLFTDITFAQVCLAALTVSSIEQIIARFASENVLRNLGLAQ